jgi:TonB family protein
MFQEALIESGPHRTWRGGTALASAIIHTAAVGALLWISALAVGDIDPPDLEAFHVGLNPPPLSDGGGRASAPPVRARAADPPRVRNQSEQFHPATEPPRELPQVTSERPADIGDETQRGDQNQIGTRGSLVGIIGAIGNDLIGQPLIPNAPIEIKGDVQSPVLTTRVDPLYPEAARRLHLSGLVILQAVIDTSGRVDDLRVTRSAGALLDSAAIAAIEKWIYRPATLHGRAVKVFLTVTVDFALH